MDQANLVPLDLLVGFDIPGELLSIEELKRGHINRTYVGTWNVKGAKKRYVHQVINHRIFNDVPGLMRNFDVVTPRLRDSFSRASGACRDVPLTTIRTTNGDLCVRDERGEYWRTVEFIEDTVSYDVCPSPRVAFEAAAILGRFQDLS